jgi:hypothetical protein
MAAEATRVLLAETWDESIDPTGAFIHISIDSGCKIWMWRKFGAFCGKN